jgi:hypothetical protein
VDSDQRGCRIARARRATAVYFRCDRAAFIDDPFLRAVIAAHSRAREYAAATPRLSTLPVLAEPEPEPEPKRAQIGNVFPGPKKHRRRPHFANNAERSPTVLGAMRDQPRDDEDLRDDRDCLVTITDYRLQINDKYNFSIIFIIHIIYIISVSRDF